MAESIGPSSVLVASEDRYGFRPSDAALVSTNHFNQGNLAAVIAAKDAQIETINTRHQLERATKDVELAVERATARLQVNFEGKIAEVRQMVATEAAITRAQSDARFGSALNQSQVELLFRQFIKAPTGV